MPAGGQEALGVEAAELGLGTLGAGTTWKSAQISHQDQPSSFPTHFCYQDSGFFLAH